MTCAPLLPMAMDETDPTPPEPPEPTGPAHAGPRCEVDLLADRRLMDADDARWLRRNARAAMVVLEVAGEVRVRVVDDAEMARAHEQYTGATDTTDVLTFDLADGASARTRILDTDLLVCIDEAARQARARRIEPRRELLLYIVHGVLHCLGHDDHDDAGFARMHELEDRVLDEIGVGATFAAPYEPVAPDEVDPL